jgi:hypothetical protein
MGYPVTAQREKEVHSTGPNTFLENGQFIFGIYAPPFRFEDGDDLFNTKLIPLSRKVLCRSGLTKTKPHMLKLLQQHLFTYKCIFNFPQSHQNRPGIIGGQLGVARLGGIYLGTQLSAPEDRLGQAENS